MDDDRPGPPLEQELDAMDQRILGALLEKQTTVPSSYPLTLVGVRTACNQTSSRDPLSSYDDRELELRLRDLKHRELVRVVVADRGQRTLKYHQLLDERLDLAADERALLTVLLLRGPQAPGELRTRTERLHVFADRGEVEELLARMATRGFVHELPRRAGQHDARWMHLLGPGSAEPDRADPVEAIDRERVLADGPLARDQRVRAAYDALAAAQRESGSVTPAGDPQERPFDAWLLSRVAARAESGPVADVGCGSGWATTALAAAGAHVVGYDVSGGMIELARSRHPDLRFETGDLRRLLRPPTAPGWAAITAWFSLSHLAPSEAPAAIAALARVLRPGGELALALHAGADVRVDPALADVPEAPGLVLHEPAELIAAVERAGLIAAERYLRGPLEGEDPGDRLYVVARAAD